MKTLTRGVVAAAVVVILAGCGERSAAPAGVGPDGKLHIVVSTPPQVWLADQVGGDRVSVTALLTPGSDPHTYQVTDAQASEVARAAIYFSIGVPFEQGRWFQAVEQSRRLQVVDTRKGITLRDIEGHDHHGDDHGHDHHAHEGGKDPHIWTDPRNLMTMARTMADAMAASDPQRAEAYRQDLQTTLTRLAELDRQLHQKLDPLKGHSFFVFHPAWGYFADAYGLKQIPVELGGKQPSDAELTALIRQATQAGTKVIFVQPQIAGQAALAVAAAIKGEVRRLDPLAQDIAAALRDAADAIAETYKGAAPIPAATKPPASHEHHHDHDHAGH